MGEVELLALYWTVCGPVGGPRRPRMEPVRLARPLRERRQGRLQGARAVARRHRAPARDEHAGRDEADLRRRGPQVPAGRVPGRLLRRRRATRARADSDKRRRLLFDTAAAFDAHHIKVGNIPGTAMRARRADRVIRGAVRGRGQPHRREGRLRVHAVRRQRQHARHRAASSSTEADQPNGGLAIDTWHMGKLGIPPDELKRIPSQYLTWVELSDGQFENMEDPIDEVVNHRHLPGEGEFDIPGYVEACREVGYEGPVGRRGALRGAARPADRGRVSACLRDDDRAVRRGRRIDEERGR